MDLAIDLSPIADQIANVLIGVGMILVAVGWHEYEMSRIRRG